MAQAEAERTFNAAMAELKREHGIRYSATLAALDEGKAGDQNSPEFAKVQQLHDAAKRAADTSPIFAARQHAYDVADAEYRAAVQAASAEHGVLTGAAPRG